MVELIWLAVGFFVGGLIAFLVVNGKRHKERLENEDRIKALRLASDTKMNAEIELVKRRLKQNVATESNEKLEKMAADLFPVIDAMQMAIGLKTDNVDSVKDGVGMVYERLEKVLEKHGCITIHPHVGDAFDPSIHQAVACHGEPTHILDVKRVGFQVGDKVLRSAAVEVGDPSRLKVERPIVPEEEEKEVVTVKARKSS